MESDFGVFEFGGVFGENSGFSGGAEGVGAEFEDSVFDEFGKAAGE